MERLIQSAQYVGAMSRNPIPMIMIARALRPTVSMHRGENVSKIGITGLKGLAKEKNRKEKQNA